MKIAIYNVTTASKIGGIEIFCTEIAKEFMKMGFEAHIISGEGSRMQKDLTYFRYSFIDRSRVFDLGNRFKKFIERVSFFKSSYTHFEKYSYDLVIITKPMDFFMAYFVKKMNKNTKVLFISGGEDFYGFDKFFVKYVDFLASVSKDNRKKIESRYKRYVELIYNGVDTKRFIKNGIIKNSLREKFNLTPSDKVIMSVGRVVGWKGHILCIEALTKLKDYKFILIGTGDKLEELKKEAKKRGVEDRVLFLGLIEHDRLAEYFNIADVYVQPSIGHEAFGITIIEALSCGILAVVSRNGGMVDIVEEGVNGYIFELNDVNSMCQKIELAYAKKDELSKECINSVHKRFTWEIAAKKMINLYRREI